MAFDSQHPSHRRSHECPQCAAAESAPATASPFHESRVIPIRDYLKHQVSALKKELASIEKETSDLMNCLIREADQAAAQKLQRQIGLLENQHAERLRQRRHYQALRKKFTS